MTSAETVFWLIPEMILVVAAGLVFVGGAFYRNHALWASVALLFLLAASAVAGWTDWNTDFSSLESNYSGPITVDWFAHAMRWLSLGVGALFLLTQFRGRDKPLAAEAIGSLLLIVCGLSMVAAAADLVLLFVSLELISIPTYILLFLGRKDQPSAEATAKYFFLSILSSAILLYGFSFLYGLAGTTSLPEIQAALSTRSGAITLEPLALVLIVAGLGFKIAAAPFHFYAPDVYQGTTNLNAGLLSVAPKIAGILAFIRLVGVGMGEMGSLGWGLCLVIALLTMTIGNVSALWQSNFRRMMGFSSIAHAGYMMIGLSTALAYSNADNGYGGFAAMIIYLTTYAVASYGVFAAVTYLGSDQAPINDVEDLSGLGKTFPVMAVLIAIFMFSLAGLPPLAGFIGKLSIFGSAIQTARGLGLDEPAAAAGGATIADWFPLPSYVSFILLAVVGAMNAAIGAAYYLRVISVMYFGECSERPSGNGGWGPAVTAALCGGLTLLIGVAPQTVWTPATEAERSLEPVAAAPVEPVSGPNDAQDSGEQVSLGAADR